MIGRGVHVTIAEDILKVKYTKFKENLLFTFRGKTFCYDIFIVYHSLLSVFLMHNPVCFPPLHSIFSGRS